MAWDKNWSPTHSSNPLCLLKSGSRNRTVRLNHNAIQIARTERRVNRIPIQRNILIENLFFKVNFCNVTCFVSNKRIKLFSSLQTMPTIFNFMAARANNEQFNMCNTYNSALNFKYCIYHIHNAIIQFH